MRSGLACLAAATMLAATAPAMADSIKFSQFSGVYGNVVAGVTTDGVAFSITGPGTGWSALTQSADWQGTFPDGSTVLYDDGAPGITTISFAAALTSFSDFAVQSNAYGDYETTVVASLANSVVGTFMIGAESTFAPGTVPAFAFSIAGGFDRLDVLVTNDSGGYGLGNAGTPEVPEPSTWAMMIVGMGMLGAALRFARKPDVSVSYR